jgi:hypothetical protein
VTPSPSDRTPDGPGSDSWVKRKAEAFFAGELSNEDRDAFEREMAEDPELARRVYEAMGMGPVFHEALHALRTRHLESHARIADRSISKHVPWWGRTRSRLVLAVVVSALVFLVVFVSNTGDKPRVDPRSPSTPGSGFSGMTPSGDVQALPIQFAWTPHPTAGQYRFEITDDSLQRVYSTITSETTLIVALDRLYERGFRSGTWKVVPLDLHGGELGSSEEVRIRAVVR